MKTLPEHTEEIDNFYKTKSEDDFAVDLPNDFWNEVVSKIPSTPLVPNQGTEILGKGRNTINFYHGACFYTAGVLSTILIYALFFHSQPNVTLETTPKINDVISPTNPTRQDVSSFSSTTKLSDETHSGSHKNVKEEQAPANYNYTPDPKTAETPIQHISQEPPSESKETSTTTNTAEKSAIDIPQTQNAEETPASHNQENDTKVDFYLKHSKKANDSLAKKLFIPKK